MTAFSMLMGFVFLGLAALILLGWVVPLIAGILRLRRGLGGKVLTGVGSVWGLLAACFTAFVVYNIFTMRHRYETDTFRAAEYKGAVGTVTLPYDGAGSLSFRYESLDGKENKWWSLNLTNGIVVMPAGRITVNNMSVSLADSAGKPAGHLSCSMIAPQNETFTLDPNGTHSLSGGFPLTASIEAKPQGNQVSMDFKMVDTAGNKIAWYAAGERKPPTFEAVSPAGECFWRDKFEYG